MYQITGKAQGPGTTCTHKTQRGEVSPVCKGLVPAKKALDAEQAAFLSCVLASPLTLTPRALSGPHEVGSITLLPGMCNGPCHTQHRTHTGLCLRQTCVPDAPALLPLG